MDQSTKEPDESPSPTEGGAEPDGPDDEQAEREARRRAAARRARWRRAQEIARTYSRLIIFVAALLVLIAVFGFPRRHSSGDSGPGVGDMPAYQVDYLDEHTMHVLTDVTKPEAVRLVFDDVRDKQVDGDWWDVVVRCASIPADQADTTIATGRFANTVAGEQVTGLTRDEADFRTTTRTDCDPLTSDVPGAVSAEDIYADVRAAGLRVISPRDSSNACAEVECLSRTLTDQFTVIVWPDTAAAERWAALATIDVWQVGPVTTVQVNEGGFDPEGPERARYEAVFAQAAIDAGTPGPVPTTTAPGNAVGL